MKRSFIIAIFVLQAGFLQAQSSIPARAAERTKSEAVNRTDNKIDQGIDKGFDKTEEAIGNIFKKKDKSKKKESADNSNNDASTGKSNAGSTKNSDTNVKGSSDFVPGSTVIFEDHFTKDPIGDFPANWNTNGSGSIVTIDGVPGKWLSVVHNTIVHPVLKKSLPENCTIEFDLFLQTQGERSIPNMQFGLTTVKNILKEDMFYKDRFFMNVARYNERDGQTVEYGLKNDVIGNKSDFPLTKYTNKILHVAMAINKSRIRVYFDDKKLIDLPMALTADMRNNFFLNNNFVVPASEVGMLVGNLRIASGEVDARSLLIKDLMENGKAVTNDILFDVNSDKIKTASFAIISQFGDALQNNPALKIKIIGHTDSDGSDAANLILSQKRAAAVKTYITENYAVAGNRIQTDGKGSSQPLAPNTTADGKTKNRRVEFIKL